MISARVASITSWLVTDDIDIFILRLGSATAGFAAILNLVGSLDFFAKSLVVLPFATAATVAAAPFAAMNGAYQALRD